MKKLFPESDTSLLKAIASGDEFAFRQFYDHWSGRIHAFAFKLSNSEELADELLQEVFIRIWQHRQKLADVENAQAYLFQMARNQTFTLLKQIAREEQVLNDYAAGLSELDNGTQSKLEVSEYHALLTKAMEQLSPKQQEVYTLCQLEGLSYQQAADQLGLSPLTIKTHMQQAIKAVRAFMLRHIALFLVLFLYF